MVMAIQICVLRWRPKLGGSCGLQSFDGSWRRRAGLGPQHHQEVGEGYGNAKNDPQTSCFRKVVMAQTDRSSPGSRVTGTSVRSRSPQRDHSPIEFFHNFLYRGLLSSTGKLRLSG